MVVKEGYKQTEIGVIPEDWETMKLGDLFEFKNGLNKEKHFFGYGTPILNYMDVFNYSGIISNDIKGRVFLTNPEIKTYEVKKGDVFFTRTSETVEEIGITTVVLENVVATVFSGFVLRGRPKNSILDLNFKKYCFSSNFVRKEIISTASYTTRALTNGRLLANVKIVVPTLAEQTAIATALSDADALITGLEKLIAKKRNIKQGVMQQLLQPKEGWEVKTLGEVLKNTQLGGNYPNSEKISNSPLIKMGNIQRGFISISKIEYILDHYKPEERDRLKYGDVLFNTRNTLELVGKVSVWRDELPKAYFNSNLMRFEFNSEFVSSNFFMNYLLNTKDSIARLKDIATGTTSVAAIYTKDLLKIDIKIPSLKEQTRIATILSDMDAELTALEQKLEKYKKIKLGMMQELLMGKTRLV